MRALHTADLHQGLQRYGAPTPQGNSRVLDFAGTWERFVDIAIEERVDLVLVAGDTFNTRREGPEERAGFAAGLRRLADAGIEVVIVPGNHDGMTVIADASTHSLRWLRELGLPRVHVLLNPTTAYGVAGVSVTAVPYPHKRAFDRLLADLPPDERVVAAGQRLTDAIATMAETAKAKHPDLVRVFVGHLSVAGAIAGSETAMQMAWDVTVGTHAFEGFDYVALGHIHKQQAIDDRIWYPGSPEYIDFGEEGDRKSFLLVEVEQPGYMPTVRRIDSGARPIHTIEARETRNADEITEGPGEGPGWMTDWDGQPFAGGPIIRLRVFPLEKLRPEGVAFLRDRLIQAGASFVKVDPVPPARALVARADVDPDLDVIEATKRYLEAQELPPDRIEAVLAKARDLVAE